jgi:HlyD family secretion protein
MKKWILTIVVIVAAAAAAIGGVFWYRTRNGNAKAYRTATVDVGDLVQTVRATGVIQPIRLVAVGTQVNGPVQKLNVDYNDLVKAGDIVAQIDPAVYQTRLAQSQANLAQSQATVEANRAKLVQADKDLARSRELAKRDMLSPSELDAAVATRDVLAAQLKVSEAAVDQSRAALRTSQTELDYTTIRSPVDGVVIDRNVSEGQTVVASMSAQVLFQIATDLRQIQVEASIPEADIGRIRSGQPVSFTVDAYDETFTGTVGQIRMAAATVQNVVTYPVVIRAANPEGRLFPSMTANISCEVERRTGVLKVPNGALRFSPATDNSTSAGRQKERSGRARGPQVWTQGAEGKPLIPVKVSTGISDGAFTELTDAGELQAGAAVIIGLAENGAAPKATVNPFTPTMPGGRQRTR